MKTILIPAQQEYLNAVNDFIGQELDHCDCPAKLRMQIGLSVEEIFVNIASYSGSPNVEVSVEIDKKQKTLAVCFTDWGIPFDPLAKLDADITLSAEER